MEDKRIHVISFEKLEELSYRIIKLFDKNYVSNDAIDSSIFVLSACIYMSKEDFVLVCIPRYSLLLLTFPYRYNM